MKKKNGKSLASNEGIDERFKRLRRCLTNPD
jgi:hypothetical protein